MPIPISANEAEATRVAWSPSAPLIPAATSLAVGIALDNAWPAGRAIYIGAAIAAFVLLLVRPIRVHRPMLPTILICAALGAFQHDSFMRRASPDALVHYITDQPTLIRITGIIASEPRKPRQHEHFFSQWLFRTNSTRFILDVETVASPRTPIRVNGLVAVSLDGDADTVRMGDRATLLGMVQRPTPAGNPGQFDSALWLRRHGVHAVMRSSSGDLIDVTHPDSDRWRTIIRRVRFSAHTALVASMPDEIDDSSNLLETMVLGHRSAITPNIEKMFIRTGTAHFLAVSGAHVGIVGWLLWGVGRALGTTRRRSAFLVIIGLVFYALIVDHRPPVLRALIVGFVLCTGIVLRRSSNSLNSLAVAAIILLLLRPPGLFDAGFQMSFAAVTAILVLQRPILDLWRRAFERASPDDDALRQKSLQKSWTIRCIRSLYYFARQSTIISLAASLASAPIAAVHFHQLVPLAWLNSIVLFPFFVATLISGTLTVAAHALIPIVTAPLRTVTDMLAELLLSVVTTLDTLCPTLPGSWVGFFQFIDLLTIAVIVCTMRAGSTSVGFRIDSTIRRWFLDDNKSLSLPRLTVAMTVLVTILSAALLALSNRPPPSLQVTTLSVGLGTATVIEFPDGRVWLYDCGTNRTYDVGAACIVPYCRRQGIKRIDRIIISHPNLDHFSGVFSVVDTINTGTITVNPHFERLTPPGGPAAAFLSELQRRGHPFDRQNLPERSDLGDGVVVERLWPPTQPQRGGWASVSANDTSTVIRIRYQDKSLLLCGDIEQFAIRRLINRGDLMADCLILPHHGSLETNTAEFVAAVDPSVTLASTHLRESLSESHMSALRDAIGPRQFYNTADDGAITIRVTRGCLTAESYRRLPPNPIR